MRVELLCVLFLETEDDLAWHDALFCSLELEVRVERYLGCVLVHVSSNLLVVDSVFGDALLIASHGCECVEDSGVHFGPSVGYDANNNLLPAVLAPRPTLCTRAKVRNVPHDTVHGARKVNLVLVVHGDGDEELRLALRRTKVLTHLVPIVDKVVRVTGHGRVPHVRELGAILPGKKAVQRGRDLTLENELAVDEFDLALLHPGFTGSTAFLFTCRSRSYVLFAVEFVGKGRVAVEGIYTVQLGPLLVIIGSKDIVLAVNVDGSLACLGV